MATKECRLGERQHRFIELYLVSGNATQAYKDAGYRCGTENSAASGANQLLRNIKVQAEIKRRRAENEERTGLTVDWIAEKMMDLYERAVAAEDYSAAGQALNMLAKHLGFYETHNTQKRGYTQEDVERLKNELKEKGFDLNRLNDRSEN